MSEDRIALRTAYHGKLRFWSPCFNKTANHSSIRAGVVLAMTKIRTLIDLNDAMTQEFAWRKREFSGIASWVRTNTQTQHRDVAIRAGVAMVYAHWEGFIKAIGTYYLEFVSRQQLKHSEMAAPFLALSMGNVLTMAVASTKTRIRSDVVFFFRDKMNDRSEMPWESKIQTRSNLSSTVLREIIDTLGLDYSPFVTKEKLIDHQLVESRNNIAHGEYLIVTTEAFMSLRDSVLVMMQEFYDQVENAATAGAYKLSAATSPLNLLASTKPTIAN